jgi:hypothetical protein
VTRVTSPVVAALGRAPESLRMRAAAGPDQLHRRAAGPPGRRGWMPVCRLRLARSIRVGRPSLACLSHRSRVHVFCRSLVNYIVLDPHPPPAARRRNRAARTPSLASAIRVASARPRPAQAATDCRPGRKGPNIKGCVARAGRGGARGEGGAGPPACSGPGIPARACRVWHTLAARAVPAA